jgi:hypothetical protein
MTLASGLKLLLSKQMRLARAVRRREGRQVVVVYLADFHSLLPDSGTGSLSLL